MFMSIEDINKKKNFLKIEYIQIGNLQFDKYKIINISFYYI